MGWGRWPRGRGLERDSVSCFSRWLRLGRLTGAQPLPAEGLTLDMPIINTLNPKEPGFGILQSLVFQRCLLIQDCGKDS